MLEMDQKILDYRRDMIDNREYKGQDRHFRDMLLAYSKGVKRMATKGVVRQASGNPLLRKKGPSSGGKLSKKNKHFKEQTENFEEIY